MPESLQLPARFRHVVFPDEAKRRKRVIDFAVTGKPPAVPAEPTADLPEWNVAFLQWLFARAGLDYRHYRPETLQRRLPACLRVLRVASAAHARRLLETDPSLMPAAVSAMLVGVTSFFRDQVVFDVLRNDVLPQLAARRGGLHAWSAGCADGSELVSLALLVAEHGMLGGSYLLGTDCRPDVIVRAKAGTFDAAAGKALPPGLLARYFELNAGGWRLVPAVRAALHWRTADLISTPEPGIWDIILCRNTTMYMRPEVASRLWERFEAALRPGGVLVLGKAERPAGTKRLALVGPCVYRRNHG